MGEDLDESEGPWEDDSGVRGCDRIHSGGEDTAPPVRFPSR